MLRQWDAPWIVIKKAAYNVYDVEHEITKARTQASAPNMVLFRPSTEDAQAFFEARKGWRSNIDASLFEDAVAIDVGALQVGSIVALGDMESQDPTHYWLGKVLDVNPVENEVRVQ